MSGLSDLPEDEFWRRVEGILATIPHEGNRATLRRYLTERRANGIRTSTLGSDANALRGFCVHLGDKPLDEVTREDVFAYATNAVSQRIWRSRKKDGSETITQSKVRLGTATLNLRKTILRDFFRWLRGTDEYPAEVKGLKVKRGDTDAIPTDQLLSRADLQAMIQAHHEAREKAIVAVLYESGLRASEFCSLNIASVEFDSYGAVLTLPLGARGLKTGARRVRLFDSVSYLHSWYEAHPKKNDGKAALFVTVSRRAPLARMTPTALWGFCARAGEKAALKKDVHPHLFRHSAATERARLGWNEGQMRAFFGWSRTSDMPTRYVHLAGLDYEDIELERRGKKGLGDRGRPALYPLRCKVCGAENLPTATFCQKCRNPVSPAAEAELQRRREEEVRDAASRIVAKETRSMIADQVRRALAEERAAEWSKTRADQPPSRRRK